MFRRMRLDSAGVTRDRSDPFEWNGTIYPCRAGCHWRVSYEGLRKIGERGRLTATENGSLSWKRYEEDVPGRPINAIWTDTPGTQDKQYVVETPPKVLERCILMTTNPGNLILDLTCGSGAMPFQAETWGRRWIAIDVAQVSIAVAPGTAHHQHLPLPHAQGLSRGSQAGPRDGTRAPAAG